LNILTNNIEDEKNQYEQRINSLTIDLENMKLKNDEQIQSYQQINVIIAEKDKEIEQLKFDLSNKMQEIQKTNDQYKELQQLFNEKSSEFNKVLETNQDSQKLLDERIQECQKIHEQHQATQVKLNELTNECQLVNRKFNESQTNLSNLTSKYQEINEKCLLLQSNLEQKNKEYEELNRALSQNKNLYDNKSREFDELNNKYNESTIALEKLNVECQQLKNDCSKMMSEKMNNDEASQKIQELLNSKIKECNNLNEQLKQLEIKLREIEYQKEESLKLINMKDNQISELNIVISNLQHEKENLDASYQEIYIQNENNKRMVDGLKDDLNKKTEAFQKEKQELLLKKDGELSMEISKRDELCNQYEMDINNLQKKLVDNEKKYLDEINSREKDIEAMKLNGAQNEDSKIEIERLNNEINSLRKQNELLLNQQTQSIAIQNDTNSIPLDLLKKFIPNPTVESALRFLTHLDDVNINLATRETILQEREISLNKKDADINQRELFIMETEKRIEKEKMDLRSVEHKLNTREQVIRDCETDIKLRNMETERYKLEIDEQIKAEWNNLNIRAKQLTDIDNQQKQLTTKLEADLMTITLERQKMYDQETRVSRLLNQLAAKENELKTLYGEKSLFPSNSTLNLDQEVKNVLSMEQPNITKESEANTNLLNNLKSSEANQNINIEPIPKIAFDNNKMEGEGLDQETPKGGDFNSKIANVNENNNESPAPPKSESGKEENPSDQEHLLKIIAKLTSTNRSLNSEVRDLHHKVQSFSKSPLYAYSQSPQSGYTGNSLRYPTMGSTIGDPLDEIDSQYSYLSQTANLYSKRPSLSQTLKPNEGRSLASTIELSRRNGTRSVQPDMLASNYMSSRMTRPLLNIGSMASPTLENLIQNSNHSPIMANNGNYLYQKSPIQSNLGMIHPSPSLSNMPTPSQLQSSRTQLMRRVEDVAKGTEERNRAYSISSRMSRQSKPGYTGFSQPGQYY